MPHAPHHSQGSAACFITHASGPTTWGCNSHYKPPDTPAILALLGGCRYLRPNTPALCGYVPKSLRGLVFRNNGLNPPTPIKYLGACDGVRPNGTSPSPSPPPRRMGGHI